MKNIKDLMEHYKKIIECLKKDEELIVKEELKKELDKVTLDIKEKIKKEQQKGNTGEEFIRLCSEFGAVISIETKDNKNVEASKSGKEKNDKDNKEDVQENNYTLASDKIISSYDGKEIDVSNLNRIEKIKAIYEHTGVEISIKDPEILELCELRFQKFLRKCNPDTYQQKYGPNWEKEVERIYKTNYLDTVHMCIASGLNEVDEKNRLKIEGLNKKVQNSEEQIETLTLENEKSFGERENLIERAAQLKLQKEELEQYKIRINEMIINNSEDESRFYSDGTLKPDMADDEYGRYTTSRKNRSRETGMQERVNDVVHVHSPLDSCERERLQNKYEQVFSQLPIPITEDVAEEEKPKSR